MTDRVGALLFHHDNDRVFRCDELRTSARNEVEASSLIRRAAVGDRRAAEALHIGFWPFVREFELAIGFSPGGAHIRAEPDSVNLLLISANSSH